jgi:hypothetical protein
MRPLVSSAGAGLCYAAIMQLFEVYRKLGEEGFTQLVRGISLGKLKSYQLYDAFKTRAHLPKLNTEHLRKATPRLWARINEGDEEFAKDFAQTVLVSHLDMIAAVLEFLAIPNQNGFFEKDLDASRYLTEGWAARTFEKFRGAYPEPLLLFYLNHLAWELKAAEQPFAPAA